MPIKPLEIKNNWPILIKVIFLSGLVISAVAIDKIYLKKTKDIPSILGEGQKIQQQTQEKLVKKVQKSNLVKDSIKSAENVGEIMLGETKSFVSDFIYNNLTDKVVKQINKLPKDQREKVREHILK